MSDKSVGIEEQADAPLQLQRLSAFCNGKSGGNPAGVVIADLLPTAEVMQALAKSVGYSETVYAAPHFGGWRVRYFAPQIEVPFCGHATIALGAALAKKCGDGTFQLTLNETTISVEGRVEADDSRLFASFNSPHTRTEDVDPQLLRRALALFSIDPVDLDMRVPPKVAIAGARHLILLINDLPILRGMKYDFADGRALMNEYNLTTILMGFAPSPTLFHTRNAFASGGVYEDPATGAATAALAGYLRELQWPCNGKIEVLQGVDMGCPSHIRAEIPKILGAPITVSGYVRQIAD